MDIGVISVRYARALIKSAISMKLEDHPEEVKKLLKEMASQLKAIDDPWYTERILSSMLPYDE